MKKTVLLSLITAGVLGSSCDNTPAPEAILPVPTEAQVNWQKLEEYAFVHFGLNTFNDLEWGYGNTPASTFNPTDLDTDQWVDVIKQAGLKGVILTAKHHDGFCLWPTKTTDYNISQSPWKDGKGDMVGELAESCRKAGLKFGIYLSPWDRNHPEYGREGYQKVFHEQINELVNNYGPIFEYWFDGANGGTGWYGGANEARSINPKEYYKYEEAGKIIRENNPDIMIFGGTDGTIRWIGNESGYAGETNWSTFDSSREDFPGNEGVKDGNEWLTGETDVSIRPGWFYHHREDHQVRSVGNLINIYYQSVGRNSTLLLNFPVALNGKIHPTDSTNVVEWRKAINNELKTNLLKDVKVSASDTRGSKFKPTKTIDNDYDTYWATSDEESTGTLTYDFIEPVLINRLLVQEYIPLGQRVSEFNIEYEIHGEWHPIETSDKMTTIGYKRIIRFDTVEASAIRINFTESKGPLCINNVEAFLAPLWMEEPSIARNANDEVRIGSQLKGVQLLYTTDGTEPKQSATTHVYDQPFKFDKKGIIKAAAYDPIQDKLSPISTLRLDIPSSYYTALNINEDTAKYLFDGNGYTTTSLPKEKKELVVSIKEPQMIKGFTYTPNQGRDATGHIDRYEFYVNNKLVSSGEFSNIKNNPITQKVFFDPVQGNEVKLKVTRVVDNLNYVGIGEFSVITED